MRVPETAPLRKAIDYDTLLPLLPLAASSDFWRTLLPDLPITDKPFRAFPPRPPAVGGAGEAGEHARQLREEGYFQTRPLIPAATLQRMRGCIDAVRGAGFPPMFALLYDLFYEALLPFDAILGAMLGDRYQLIPNFWVYHVDTSDDGKGFEPHRDAEYARTIGPDGLPTVLTLWVALSDASPLNSCIYLLPKNRDPGYAAAVDSLDKTASGFALEDIRALPAEAGTLSCWDQYVFHWGGRGSKRAPFPRVSYAAYAQRGDQPPADDATIDVRAPLDFRTRLSLVCRGLCRYSYADFDRSSSAAAVVAFLREHIVTALRH